jgi:hypothetical protein
VKSLKCFKDINYNNQWWIKEFQGGGVVKGRGSGSCLEAPSGSRAKPWWGSSASAGSNFHNILIHTMKLKSLFPRIQKFTILIKNFLPTPSKYPFIFNLVSIT